MSSFFSSLADKAQNAYKESPIASQVQQLQAKFQEHPTANESAAQGGPGAKSHTLGQLQYQFRTMQMQYSSVSPVQRIITSSKGIALDFESVKNDAKSQSKELYTWGQHQDDDLKDVTDRLAYLNFVHGSIAGELATKLDSSRSTFKELRNAESNLSPKRNIRINIQNQIARIENDKQRGMEKRLAELQQQLVAAEEEEEIWLKQVDLLKRRAVVDSEREKWAALREYAEKVVLLAEASESFVSALPSVPPSASNPYRGAEQTAAARASLQHALDNYKTNSLSHSFQPSAADLKRSDSRSFGVTHATELSNITSPIPEHHLSSISKLPTTPPPGEDVHNQYPPPSGPPPINPANLNNSPAQIPVTSSSDGSQINVPAAIPAASHDTSPIQIDAPNVEKPTVAETGVPLSAGDGGPGPQSGSLKELKASRSPVTPVTGAANVPGYGAGLGRVPTYHETAEEENNRLQQGGGSSQGAPSTPAKYESAEEEKKRLEREERERLLRNVSGAGPNKGPGGPDNGPSGNPPPYQDGI